MDSNIIYCPECQTKNIKIANFCYNCGFQLKDFFHNSKNFIVDDKNENKIDNNRKTAEDYKNSESRFKNNDKFYYEYISDRDFIISSGCLICNSFSSEDSKLIQVEDEIYICEDCLYRGKWP